MLRFNITVKYGKVRVVNTCTCRKLLQQIWTRFREQTIWISKQDWNQGANRTGSLRRLDFISEQAKNVF